MTGDNITKILDIKVNYGKAIEALSQYRQTLDQIKEAERQLKQELSNGAVTQSDYQKQMSALNQERKHAQSATRDLTRVVQNNIQIEVQQKNSMKSMRAELSNLTRQYDMLSASARNGLQGARLKSQINDITKSIKDAEMATQRFYRNVGNYQSALLAVKELGGAFHTFGGIVSGVLGGIGLDKFANTMVEAAKNFEDAMARVRAVGNPNEGEFEQLREKALELGKVTKFTATEVGDAMEELSRKGFKAAEVTEMVGHVLKEAQANVTSMADAAQVTSSTLRAFDLQVEETGRVVDVLSAACANSGTNLTQLGEAMKTAGPSAKAANVSLEETTALIGSLANVGMTGSDAGTGVKQIIMAMATMAKSTEKAREVLKHYNLEITEARMRNGELMDMLREMAESGIGNSIGDLKLVAGKYASPRLANLINNVDDAIALNDVLKNSIGENERMYNESIGKTSDALFKLKSAWENMLIGMYDSTSKYLISPIQWLTEAIRYASDNVRLFGQTFTSVLVGLMAAPAWKGLKTMGGVIATSWQTAKAGAMTAIDEINAKIAASEAEQVNLKKSADAVKIQIDTAEKERRIATNAFEIRQAKLVARARTVVMADALLTQEFNEKMSIARRSGMEAEALVKYEEQLTISLAKQKEVFANNNRILIAEVEQLTDMRIEAEMRVTAAMKEQAVIQQNMVKQAGVTKALVQTQTQMQAAAPNLTVWGKFWGSCKTGFSFVAGIFKSIGAMLKSFLPFMIIFGIMEFIQGIQRALDLMSLVADKAKEAEDRVKNASSGAENTRINALNVMKDLLKDINKEQEMYHKLSEQSYKQLKAIGHRLKLSQEAQADLNKTIDKQNKNLVFQKKTYDEIKKALEERIKIETNQSKRTALTGLMTESQQILMKDAVKYQLKGKDGEVISDPAQIFEGIDKIWNEKGDLLDYLGAWVGKDTLYAIHKEAEAAKNTYYWALKELQKLPDYSQDLIETALGDYNPSNIGSGRGGSKKEANLEQLLEKLRKYIGELQAKNETDLELAELKKLNEKYRAISGDINKYIDTHQKEIKLRQDQWKQANEYLDILKDLMPEAQDKESEDIRTKYVIKSLESQMDYYNGLKAATNRFSSVAPKGDNSREYNYLPVYYGYERSALEAEQKKAEKNLETAYLKGEYGATANEGSYDKIRKGYAAYAKQRMEIEKDFRSGKKSEDAYQSELEALDEFYHAEQEYYNRRMALKLEYARKERDIDMALLSEQQQIYAQRMQNELNMQQLMYENMLNQTHDYYRKLQYMERENIEIGEDYQETYMYLNWQATDKYWKELQDRIGEFDAQILQAEYNAAQENLQSVIEQGWDENVESYEAYQGRLIAAQMHMEEVHTKINENIEKSDETRLQATQDVIGGLIELSEELGKEDKEAAKLAKALALFNIMVNTAEAIAKMTSRESGKGVIGIATTAAGIASIMANMASAISILKQAKYAKGAVNIGGAGSETSDSIPARISRGESVINAKATKMFEPILIAMNNIGNGVALPRNNYVQTQQTADITEAFTTAASKIRPVVDVREVTRVQNRVEVLENLDNV